MLTEAKDGLCGRGGCKMSEERLERIEGLLTDLIGKVAIVHRDNIDIKEGQKQLQADVGLLKGDVGELKEDVSELKVDVAELKADVAALKDGQARIEQTLEKMAQDQISICEMFGDHEIAIRTLRRRLTGS
jgi:archaellum component FlaC